MSSIRRARSTRTPRSLVASVAIGAVATLGLVIAAPGSGAFATGNPNSPEARVGNSIASGHLMDDIESGRITESDVLHAASTGVDVHGKHIDNWMDLSAAQAAESDAQIAKLNAAAAADPKTEASLRSAKAAIHAAEAESLLSTTSSDTSRPPAKAGEISESKHWWSHIIHWFTLYINNAWLRGLVAAGSSAAAVAICAFFDISHITCGFVGAFMAGATEALESSNMCNGQGIYIKIPDTVNSHCA
ncbi:hypothetical protein [Clavibacter sp. VKM Ac-2542]|uniref:hypothetical protein n=1 Tax=Clavibacter sp. VKM Ac-2542 TaxID=2783811 RepID=UPI00188D926F|nr:hypothetical protein [Clavibacter sp. VKM Ac-2542]MBF4622432.1 hypothetical protein [Clavibacter sp. VKM Ac-2542]